MDWKSVGGIYLIRLQPDEELLNELTRWAQAHNISGGTVEGLGGVRDVELGYFDIISKSYHRWLNSGNWELVHLWGNLTKRDGAPFWHLHAVISDRNGNCQAGHLFSAVVAITAELTVRPWQETIERTIDPPTGLYLWKLQE